MVVKMMGGYLLSLLLLLSLQILEGQNLCGTLHAGQCTNPTTSCCGGEYLETTGLCPLGVDPLAKCCLPEIPCGQGPGEEKAVCIPAGRTVCEPPYKGVCPGDKICCGPLTEPPFGKVTTPSPPTPTSPPGPPGPPGPTGPPKPPGPTGPPKPTTPAPPDVVCSVPAQKDACNVLADNTIFVPDGPTLVSWGLTTVGNDFSSPYNNLYDTCDGYEIQTSTYSKLCNGAKVCLHPNVPRFIKCYRRLCGAYTVLQISSDSNGPGWYWHCAGRAVDVIIPSACRNMVSEMLTLCSSLDGFGTKYGEIVFNCFFNMTNF